MSSHDRARELARRVASRVLAERGLAQYPAARAEVGGAPRTQGVHVTAHPCDEPLRPSSRGATSSAHGGGPELVTERCLTDVPDGGRYRLARGAIVTDLAREAAWRRRITLLAPDANAAATRADGRLRVALGADHGGFALKQAVLEWVRELGHLAFDLGTHGESPVDYPDFAREVAEAVAQGRADLGICIDGAGIGSAIAANKVPGVRAAMCCDAAGARNAREHNFANVLTLGGKTAFAKDAREIVRAFLATSEGEERHARRVQKIAGIELKYSRTEDGSAARHDR
jgi:ribose 5-phosphate isomerase B